MEFRGQNQHWEVGLGKLAWGSWFGLIIRPLLFNPPPIGLELIIAQDYCSRVRDQITPARSRMNGCSSQLGGGKKPVPGL